MQMNQLREDYWTVAGNVIENQGNGYSIKIHDIVEDGLEVWIKHLREKTWFTYRGEENFVKELKRYSRRVARKLKRL